MGDLGIGMFRVSQFMVRWKDVVPSLTGCPDLGKVDPKIKFRESTLEWKGFPNLGFLRARSLQGSG